jgi:hypothetical protein
VNDAADDRHDIRVVLFDVGGVLVELGGVATLLGWLGARITLPQLWTLWLRSPSVRAFETGRIDAGQFAAGVLAELRLDVDAELFLESFARWPSALYPGALEMIGRIPSHYRRALLSNTNVQHLASDRKDKTRRRGLRARTRIARLSGRADTVSRRQHIERRSRTQHRHARSAGARRARGPAFAAAGRHHHCLLTSTSQSTPDPTL